MTISKTPWTIRQAGALHEILSANGAIIGYFNDWRDAEACAISIVNPTTLESLREELMEAEEDMKELEKKLGAAECRIDELESTISKAREIIGE